MKNKQHLLPELSYEEIEKYINISLISEINKALKYLKSDYKDLSNVLNYGDPGYIHKLLHLKKKMKIATLIKISYGLTLIKREKKISTISENYLSAWSLLRRAFKKTFYNDISFRSR